VAYLSIFTNNILPIFLTAGAGFILGRRARPDLKTVSRLVFYIFSPCLVFTSITHTELSSREFGLMAAFTLGVVTVMLLLAAGVGWAMRLPRPDMAGLVIASVFVNGGNFGLALVKFAFGDEALVHAVVYFVISSLAVYTVGVAVASLGRPGTSLRRAFTQVFLLPNGYALLAAGLFRLTQWQVPLVLDRALTLLSQAAIPVMLIVLGLQMAEARAWPRSRLALMGVACFMQLIIAPLVGLALAGALGLSGAARQAAVIQSAMPTAVITTILAVEYDLDAAFVTGTVILSTLLCPLILTPLIAYLQ
jgi:predicted permease